MRAPASPRSRQGTEPITARATCMPAALGKQSHTLCLSFLTDNSRAVSVHSPVCPWGIGAALFPEVPHAAGPLPPPPVCSTLFGAGSSGAWVQGSGLCGTRALSPLLSPPQASPLQLPQAEGLWQGACQALSHPRTRSSPLGMELLTAPAWAHLCHLPGGQK